MHRAFASVDLARPCSREVTTYDPPREGAKSRPNCDENAASSDLYPSNEPDQLFAEQSLSVETSCYDEETQVHQISSTTSTLMQEIQSLPTVTTQQIQQGDPNLENEKKKIYGHPLYPLLSVMLEKCESATAHPDSPPADTFDADIRSLRHDAQDRPFFTEEKDLDALMVKAIQVLRIHLMELHKVNELCKDFCTRYINCIKSKIQSDIIVGDSPPASPSCSEAASPPYGSMLGSGFHSYVSMLSPLQQHHGHHISPGMHHASMTHMGLGCYTNGISGDVNGGPLSPSMGPYPGDAMHRSHQGHISSSHRHDPSKQKRGVLPKRATQVMKQWLFQHLVHPYPTEDEKRQIASQINLTLLQVNNWFINARRRILQPMLDGTNHTLVADKADGSTQPPVTSKKKKAATNRPTNNRFWPASLATAASIPSPAPSSQAAATGNTVVTATSKTSHSNNGDTEEAPPTKVPKTNGSAAEDNNPSNSTKASFPRQPSGAVSVSPENTSTSHVMSNSSHLTCVTTSMMNPTSERSPISAVTLSPIPTCPPTSYQVQLSSSLYDPRLAYPSPVPAYAYTQQSFYQPPQQQSYPMHNFGMQSVQGGPSPHFSGHHHPLLVSSGHELVKPEGHY